MSLINDALKRAKQAQQRNSPPPNTAPSLQPLEVSRRTTSGPGLFLPVAVAAFALLGGGLLVWFAFSNGGSKRATIPANVNPTSTAPVAPPAPADAAAAVSRGTATVASAPTPKPLVLLPATKPTLTPTASGPVSRPQVLPAAVAPSGVQLASAPAPATNTASVSAEPPPPPAWPKLQGIVYRPDRPSALLNGKTILVGGRSGDFLVVAITQQSVTVVRAGQTNVLSLAD